MSAERPRRKSNNNRRSGSRPKSQSRWGQGNRERRSGGGNGDRDRKPAAPRRRPSSSSSSRTGARGAESRGSDSRRDFNPRSKGGRYSDRGKPANEPNEQAIGADLEDESPDLLFGRHAVLAALEEGRTLNKIWVTSQVRYNAKFHNRLDRAKAKGAVIDEVPMHRLNSITKGGKHQGIAAQAAPFVYEDLQALIKSALESKSDPLLVVADGIQDPHNLGAIARTTEAMGGHGLIVPQRRAVGVTSTVMKVAAGALETLPIAREINLTRAIEALKAAGFWIYGTSTSGDKAIYATEFSGPTAVVVGSEGKGLGLRVENACDFLLSIPMPGKTESLNASVATGMILSEINRQRLQKTLELPQ